MKNESKWSSLFDLSLIFLFGLLPLTWFVANHFILSVDSNLPFTFERWINEVFFSWDTHLRAGWSPRMIESTHFFFFVQWFFQFLGLDLLGAQRAVFVFWFMLPGFTQYFFLRYLFRDMPPVAKRLACLAGVMFYMFNLYLEPIWLGLNVSNLLGYAFLPLLLRIWVQVLEERRSPVLYGFLFALVSIMASGIATNPANVFVCSIPFFIFAAIALVKGFKTKGGVIHLILFLFFTLLFSLLFNAYWILTEWQKVFVTSFDSTKAAGEGFIVEAWLEGVSRYTSFTNVIRLLGSWTWFASPRAYNTLILTNPIFVIFSWLVPVFGLIGLFCKTRYRSLFGVVLVLGIILSMGIHFPFKHVYMWMVEHVPFFWLVRSPWYKFMILTCLGYSYFFGVAAAKIYQWGMTPSRNPKRRRRLTFAVVFLVIFLSPIYAFPVSLGKMFLKPEESSYTNHFQVPEYVYQTSDYLNKKPGNNRIWSLPGKGFFMNNWGFSGFSPFLPYEVSKPILYTDHNLSIPISEQWLSAISHPFHIIQNSFEKQLTPNLYRVLGLFNVDTLVTENDFKFAALPVPYSKKEMSDSVELLWGVDKEKSFGEWDVYQLAQPQPLIYKTQSVNFVEDHIDALVPLSNTNQLNRSASFFAEDLSDKQRNLLFQDQEVKHLVLNNRSWFDLAVDLMEPIEKVRLSFDKKEIPAIEINVSETGFYYFYATAGRSIGWTRPRPLVDKQELAQTLPVQWSPNLLEKENWLSVNQIQIKPVLFQDRPKKEMNQAIKWEMVGQLYLEEGKQELRVEGWQPDKGNVTVAVVPKEEAQVKLSRVQELYKSSTLSVSQFLSTDSAWRHGGWAQTDPGLVSPDPAVKWKLAGVFEKLFEFQGSSQWHQLRHDDIALEIENNQKELKQTRLAFKVLSIQPTQREIYVFLNGERIQKLNVEPMEELGVSVLLQLNPGLNKVHFQTNGSPEPISKFYKNDDERRVIMLAKQIEIGHLSFVSDLYLPERESFVVRVYPFRVQKERDPEFSDLNRTLKINNKALPLKMTKGEFGAPYWESAQLHSFSGKRVKIEFKEREGNRYFIEVLSGQPASLENESLVEFTRLNPTKIEGSLQTNKPEWFIFSESFDPRWVLLINGKEFLPIKVNSYANAYKIPSTNGEVVSFELEFGPQKWMWRGIRISLASLAGSTLFVLILLLFKRHYRRKKYTQ